MEKNQRLSYTLNEAAELTGISAYTLRRMVLRGQLMSARIGKKILIPAGELQRIVAVGANSGPVRQVEEKAS
jgi:excisionase family DNA binding protein